MVNGDVIAGDVRFYPSASFASLTTVNGDLRFEATKQWGPPWLNLTSVTGELAVLDHPGQTTMAQFPISATVGAFRLEGNPALVTLLPSFQVTSGDIEISQNPALPQCRVDAFLANQAAGGWTGSAVVSDTAAGPCP